MPSFKTPRRRIYGAVSRCQAGFTLIELLIVIAIVGILASISMALYCNARVRAGEATAVATLQAINQAQFAFAQACGNQRYAASLASLATAMPSTGQAFVSPDLGADPLVKSGYQFAMAGTAVTDAGLTCTGGTPVESSNVTAEPVPPRMSGSRISATDSDRVLYEDADKTFATDMPEKGTPTHGLEMKEMK